MITTGLRFLKDGYKEHGGDSLRHLKELVGQDNDKDYSENQLGVT